MKTREEVNLLENFVAMIKLTLVSPILCAAPLCFIILGLYIFEVEYFVGTMCIIVNLFTVIVFWIWFLISVSVELYQRRKYNKVYSEHHEKKELEDFIKFCKTERKELS